MAKKIFVLFSLLFLVVVLVYACFDSYYHFNDLYPSVADFNDDPERYDGVEIEKVGVMKDLENNTFILVVKSRDVLVKSFNENVKQVKKGTVIVNGVCNKEGYIELTDIHYSPYHFIKYAISFIALIVAFVYLIKEWKLTKRGFKSNA